MSIEDIEQTQRKISERIYEYPEEPIYPWQHVEDPKHAIILHRNETERRKYCNNNHDQPYDPWVYSIKLHLSGMRICAHYRPSSNQIICMLISPVKVRDLHIDDSSEDQIMVAFAKL